MGAAPLQGRPRGRQRASDAGLDRLHEPAAESRQAEIAERLGDRAMAHYRRFLELWSDADPELAPWVTNVRNRLQELERMDDG